MMKIGIIVHSKTGNTLSVAQRLEEKLLTGGHTVKLEQIIATDEQPTDKNKVEFRSKPDLAAYDVLFIGAPVWAFSLSTIMTAYLMQGESLEGKKVGCFVTQQFPYAWLGGNRSVNQMKKLCVSKGAEVVATEIINWSSKKREEKIIDTVERLSALVN